MDKEILFKIWVVKWCIKILYPKLNPVLFLTFLCLKYKFKHLSKAMDEEKHLYYTIKPVSCEVHESCSYKLSNESKAILSHKCIIIPQEDFIELACQNLFYIDNGILWISLKLGPFSKKTLINKNKKSLSDKKIKYNLNWSLEDQRSVCLKDNHKVTQKCRIVPVIGSQLVDKNTSFCTEDEHHNLLKTFGLEVNDELQASFHPVLKIDHAPRIAQYAEVSLLAIDLDLPNEVVKEILSNYFERPKVIHKNDVFPIKITPEIVAKYYYTYTDLSLLMDKLYFKCQKLGDTSADITEGNQEKFRQPFYIVKGVTQLSLGDSIHEIKPMDRYLPLSLCNGKKSNIERYPEGLQKIFTQLQEALSLFLGNNLSDLSWSFSNPIMPLFLLTGATGSGRHQLVKAVAHYNGLNCLQIDCNALQSSTAKQTEAKISSTIQRAKSVSPVIVLLDNFEVFAVDAENNEDCRLVEFFVNSIVDLYQHYTKHSIIFVAVTEKADLKPNILRIFLDKFHIPKLNNQQRYEMLQWFTSAMNLNINAGKECENDNVDNSTDKLKTTEALKRIAAKTETFLLGDLDTLVHFAMRDSYLQQLNNSVDSSQDPSLRLVKEQHFNSALETMRSLQSQHLDAPKIPKVYWEDIGGLENLKKELLKTIEYPIKYPHLFKNSSLKRSGLLLYGPPGCGKTLVAKAVSTELNVSFLSVKGPELLNMYIGQSEENVRQVFARARASSPCIVFLDELDSLAPRRGAAGDAGGAADRLVSQLLAELDGVGGTTEEDTSCVVVMGATNRPDLLEQSLLRPGRLDKLIYVAPYTGLQQKTQVLTALCRTERLSENIQLDMISQALPARVTGADMLAVVSVARSVATRRLLTRLAAGEVKESELTPESIIIEEADLWEGVRSFRPSVTDEELAYYESLQYKL